MEKIAIFRIITAFSIYFTWFPPLKDFDDIWKCLISMAKLNGRSGIRCRMALGSNQFWGSVLILNVYKICVLTTVFLAYILSNNIKGHKKTIKTRKSDVERWDMILVFKCLNNILHLPLHWRNLNNLILNEYLKIDFFLSLKSFVTFWFHIL